MKEIIKKIASGFHTHMTGIEPPQGFLSSLVTLVFLLIFGTFFYSKAEGWSFLDSLYFTVVTITTVGYGDLHPTNAASKVFTIFLIFMGVGLGLYIITTFADSFLKGRDKRIKQLESLLGNSQRIEKE